VAKAKQVAEVVSKINEAIAVYGLTAQDLGFTRARSPAAKTGLAAPAKRPSRFAKTERPKYRDEAGNIWGGGGPRPAWVPTVLASGRRLEEFAVS
jgi:DNA-binding protein H-NS